MKQSLLKIFGSFAAGLILAGASVPAFAEINASGNIGANTAVGLDGGGAGTASVNTSLEAHVGATTTIRTGGERGILGLSLRINRAKDHADQEINRRINALTNLENRINAMVRLSADEKSSLSSSIQAQISAMQNLETQVGSDAQAESTSSLKTDIASITKAYRIFMLILPQGEIRAGSDRVLDIGSALTSVSAKLQTRIAAAQSAGNNTSAAASALAEMNAKIADANAQAQAAVSLTANLKPDNGDQTVMQSNIAALKQARTDLQAAQHDLVVARQDAGAIFKALASFRASESATTSASTSAGSQ